MAESPHIVVIGAGGNIGSHLLPHLANVASRLTLVDPDVYEPANVVSQNIDTQDVGRAKVEAQAEKLLRKNPALQIESIQQYVEDVPLGRLRGDLIIGALDTRIARQRVNEIAWRLSTPWIDIGVLGGAFKLARVNLYDPAEPGAPCLECQWSDQEYAELEVGYPCQAQDVVRAQRPTLATSALGALAASLAAIEVYKLLAGEATLQGGQIVYDSMHHSVLLSTDRRNPRCRFDHGRWSVASWECPLQAMTLREALTEFASLGVDGHPFVRALVCPGCGRREDALRLDRPAANCPVCDRRMAPPGFDIAERLDAGSCAEYGHLTLAQLGLLAGDIVTVGEGPKLMIVEQAA